MLSQCIFADTELRLVFAPPKINQFRNEHTILGDFNAEQDLYNKAGELINYLSSWTSSETSIAERSSTCTLVYMSMGTLIWKM